MSSKITIIEVDMTQRGLYRKIEAILGSRERAVRTFINKLDVTMADDPEWVAERLFRSFNVEEYQKHTLIRCFEVKGRDFWRFERVVGSNKSRFKVYLGDKVFVVRKKLDICQFLL